MPNRNSSMFKGWEDRPSRDWQQVIQHSKAQGNWVAKREQNKRQSERDEQRQIMKCLLCHGKKCGYHSGNKERHGVLAEVICSELHGRKIPSVANWSTKLRIPSRARSQFDAGGLMRVSEQKWKMRPNLSYAQSQRVLVIVWVWRKSKRERSRTTPGFWLRHERQRGKKSRCECGLRRTQWQVHRAQLCW